ncbi:hypothetical protein K7X08_004126 [Anisodus acutangulus]|uniref:Uncharacterized protein n=1 Tax=Anisodus acutangulus TaxID=402998 RepID=A0A9Q1RH55_9SOLA|nr:hypothetical protein K7X08_004126 [Anisodus acutangulus]
MTVNYSQSSKHPSVKRLVTSEENRSASESLVLDLCLCDNFREDSPEARRIKAGIMTSYFVIYNGIFPLMVYIMAKDKISSRIQLDATNVGYDNHELFSLTSMKVLCYLRFLYRKDKMHGDNEALEFYDTLFFKSSQLMQHDRRKFFHFSPMYTVLWTRIY